MREGEVQHFNKCFHTALLKMPYYSFKLWFTNFLTERELNFLLFLTLLFTFLSVGHFNVSRYFRLLPYLNESTSQEKYE